MSPFTGSGLTEIKVRSKGRSELSGRTDRPLHCMHLDHTKNPNYNKPDTGLRVTVIEHLAFHIYYRDDEAKIGLNQRQNEWAIDMLNREAVEFMYKIGKIDELDDEIADSILMWDENT